MHRVSLSPYDLSKVVHLLLAVAAAAELPPEPHERQRAIDLARSWGSDETTGSIEAIVDTAYVAARRGVDIDALARDVAGVIGPEGVLRLLSHLGQIAQADGHLELREARVIGRIRAAMHRSDETHSEGGPRRADLSAPPAAPDNDARTQSLVRRGRWVYHPDLRR